MFGRLVSSVTPHLNPSQSAQCVLRVVGTQPTRMPFSSTSESIEVKGKSDDSTFKEILTPDALKFMAKLHREFNEVRLMCLKNREDMYVGKIIDDPPLDFLDATHDIRADNSWKISELPEDLQRRRVEITGPPTQKMIINAMNSGADAYMCDFEDSIVFIYNLVRK